MIKSPPPLNKSYYTTQRHTKPVSKRNYKLLTTHKSSSPFPRAHVRYLQLETKTGATTGSAQDSVNKMKYTWNQENKDRFFFSSKNTQSGSVDKLNVFNTRVRRPKQF